MDGNSRFVETLDSLWFFSNIFSLRNKSAGSASDQITQGNHAIANDSLRKDLASAPISPNLEKQLNDLPSAEVLVPMSPKCVEFAAEIEPQLVDPVEMKFVECQRSTKKFERRRTRRTRSKGNLIPLRKHLREPHLDLEVNQISGSWMFEQTIGYRRFGSQRQNELPSFNDNVAMKEHLKSWANAVACIVR